MESHENCLREAENCLAIAQDETRSAEDRFGATMGEIDWRASALHYDAEYQSRNRLRRYHEHLLTKRVITPQRGMDASKITLNPNLKPHVADSARWALHGGNRAIFSSFGLGKTSLQLQLVSSVLEHNAGDSLIVCPKGVKQVFSEEAHDRGFDFTPEYIRTDAEYRTGRQAGLRHFITNYERVRDGDIDPNQFTVTTLDEASVLRSFGSKTYQTFLTLFDAVKFKFVATATPSPNKLKELIHYAGFLGIMDTGQALTRFFKRDSTQAGNLTIHPHKEREFYLWLSTWALFVTTPSDIGHSDNGYVMPPLKVIRHRLPVDHSSAGFDSWGQGRLTREAALSLSAGAREKRDSLDARIERCRQIIAERPHEHYIIWHDLDDEMRALRKALPGIAVLHGSETDMDERDSLTAQFARGEISMIATKPKISGSGTNWQKHCHINIFLGLTHKFNDFIQACHRTLRYGQDEEVEVHLIYTESEDFTHDNLMRKWDEHKALTAQMTGLIREFGLNNIKIGDEMSRSIGVKRQEVKGELFTAVNNDNVPEIAAMPDNSVDLIVTSWPFSDHYEYTESMNDFGHNDGDKGFFAQMEFLTPEIMRVLAPGRLYCVHAKDRIVYGSVSGDGMYTVNRFSDKCADHCERHGFRFCGRITVVTDVVRENNQTYRLGWTENCKDGTKMGVGSPEYILLFRKLPTDQANAYADAPVTKSKDEYTRARWQFDAHSFWRDRGDRFLTPDEIRQLPMDDLRKLWRSYTATHLYNFDEHVEIAKTMEQAGILPSSFMALDVVNPGSPHVWDDIPRMLTLNTEQTLKRRENHVCPLQLKIVERLIERYSAKGELVLDPFAGIGTVPYCAVKMGRRGYGVELNEIYWRDSLSYLKAAEMDVMSPTLFDLLEEQTA